MIRKYLVRKFLLWVVKKRCKSCTKWFRIVAWNEARSFGMRRFMILWHDEYWSGRNNEWYWRRPWYLPFNAFVHWWRPVECAEPMHDHARWTITVVLKGHLWERTPKGCRLLLPGSVVFRSHKAIHSFEMSPSWKGKTWTLFIVGRKVHQQNIYTVTPVKV